MAVLELIHPGGCSLRDAVVVVVCYIIDKCTGRPREIREGNITKRKKYIYKNK